MLVWYLPDEQTTGHCTITRRGDGRSRANMRMPHKIYYVSHGDKIRNVGVKLLLKGLEHWAELHRHITFWSIDSRATLPGLPFGRHWN